MEKYNSIKDSKNDSDDDTNFIEKKFNTLTKELDKMVNRNKKKRSSSHDSDDNRKKPSRRSVDRNLDRRRQDSPDRMRRGSRANRRDSPPTRKHGHDIHIASRRDSPARNRRYLEKRRDSPERKRHDFSDKKRKDSPERRVKGSPDKRRKGSPKRQHRESLERRKDSPQRKRSSPVRKHRDSKRRSRTPEKRKDQRQRSRSTERMSNSNARKRLRTPLRARRESPIDDRKKTEDSMHRNPSPPKEKVKSLPRRKQSSSDSSSTPPPRPSRQSEDSDDDRRVNVTTFGLVTASGEKIALERKDEVRRYTREELKTVREAPKKTETKRRKPLTEEEMEAVRIEMMKNADWREKDREQTVKKHREAEEKEKQNHQKDFDKDFLNRHMKKAQDQVNSVGSRIRSNVNNIQRSGRTMDSNFAKR